MTKLDMTAFFKKKASEGVNMFDAVTHVNGKKVKSKAKSKAMKISKLEPVTKPHPHGEKKRDDSFFKR